MLTLSTRSRKLVSHGSIAPARAQAQAPVSPRQPAPGAARRGARHGVSRTALYRHFADKRALLAAVATEGFRTLRLQLVAAWQDGGRNRAAFDAMGAAYVRFAIA